VDHKQNKTHNIILSAWKPIKFTIFLNKFHSTLHRAPNFGVKSGYIWEKGRIWGKPRKSRYGGVSDTARLADDPREEQDTDILLERDEKLPEAQVTAADNRIDEAKLNAIVATRQEHNHNRGKKAIARWKPESGSWSSSWARRARSMRMPE
jgi:hypothetical protein